MTREARPTELDAREREVAETVGRLMHFWGFKRGMGRLWTALFLAPSPLTAADLGDRLGMSAGSVSMGLSELEKWGCVHRSSRSGDRHDYFSAETDIWKMVRGVLRSRELVLIQEFRSTVARADAELAEQRRAPDPGHETTSQELEYKAARLQQLGDLIRIGESLLVALVHGKVVDPAPLVRPVPTLQPDQPPTTRP